jgi:hypothetical protein
VNDVFVVVVPSFAVMVTVVGPAGPSVAGADHDHVPDAFVPAFVTVPVDADKLTVSPAFVSLHVPVLDTFEPSGALTLVWSEPITGAAFEFLKWA